MFFSRFVDLKQSPALHVQCKSVVEALAHVIPMEFKESLIISAILTIFGMYGTINKHADVFRGIMKILSYSYSLIFFLHRRIVRCQLNARLVEN
jgi:hypothetical protein